MRKGRSEVRPPNDPFIPGGYTRLRCAHRTQRVHWMQRVMMVLMSGPMFLSSTALFPSEKRLRSEPNCMDWSWEQGRPEQIVLSEISRMAVHH